MAEQEQTDNNREAETLKKLVGDAKMLQFFANVQVLGVDGVLHEGFTNKRHFLTPEKTMDLWVEQMYWRAIEVATKFILDPNRSLADVVKLIHRERLIWSKEMSESQGGVRLIRPRD